GIRDYKVTGVQTCALPIFLIPVQDLTQSQSIATKTPNPLISLFWCRSLSRWIVTGRRVVGRTAKLRCSGSTPLGASNPLQSPFQIGRASCRERVEMSVLDG